jgi:hypothetical protein
VSQKVPVTERALIQRINRRLKQDGEKLCAARGEGVQQRLGRFYVVETGHHVRPKNHLSSGVVHTDVDVEKLAAKLGLLKPWEMLAG